MNIPLKKEWLHFLKDYFNSEDWKKLSIFLDSEYDKKDIFPNKENVLKAFSYFKPENTKIIIIGQDPYHKPGFATGLAFSKIGRAHV